jgi:colicin import membrane protein
MKRSRLFGFLVGGLVLLGLAGSPAQARESSRRSSRSYNDGTGGSSGLDRSRTREDRAREQEKAREEERQKEEQRKKEEALKKEAEAKKTEAEAKKREEAKAKAARVSKPTPPAQKTASKATPPKDGGKDATEAKEAEAAKLCDQAEAKFADGKLESVLEGTQLLRQTINEFPGTEAAARAETRLEQLLANEAVGPAILAAEANGYFTAQRYRKAQNAYQELLQRFPNCEQAAEANQRLAEIRDGDLLSKTAYTQEELADARLWFLAGSIHLENARLADALSAWRKVIEDYPGCRYATEAAGRLAVAAK